MAVVEEQEVVAGHSPVVETATSDAQPPQPGDAETGAAVELTFEDLAAATDGFAEDKKIGSGGFGRVYQVAAEKLPLSSLALPLLTPSHTPNTNRESMSDPYSGPSADAVAEGSLRSDLSPEVVSRLVFGTVNSLVDWYSPDGSLDPDTLAEGVADLLFRGLEA